MAYPYKKMTSEDFDYIRSVTASDRVWVGDEIAKEYYRDEMPEYGSFSSGALCGGLNKEEISAIMAYAYKENIPVVCRGAGTGLAGGATCKYGGIMLSVMRMNKIFPIDRKNQNNHSGAGSTSHRYPGGSSGRRTFLSAGPGRKNSFHRRQCYHKCRWHESGTIWTDQGFRPLYRGSYAGWFHHEFFIQRCEEHNGI